MQRLEVSGAVRPLWWSLGFKGLKHPSNYVTDGLTCAHWVPVFMFRRETSGHTVAQLVEALRYKPEGHGFVSRRCHWNFSLT